MLAEVTPIEIGFLVLLAILLFGAKKLPDIGKGLGRGIKEFREAAKGATEEAKSSTENTPPAPPAKDESGTGGPAAGA
jgi:sec-independent protein translocase protein TatA